MRRQKSKKRVTFLVIAVLSKTQMAYFGLQLWRVILYLVNFPVRPMEVGSCLHFWRQHFIYKVKVQLSWVANFQLGWHETQQPQNMTFVKNHFFIFAFSARHCWCKTTCAQSYKHCIIINCEASSIMYKVNLCFRKYTKLFRYEKT